MPNNTNAKQCYIDSIRGFPRPFAGLRCRANYAGPWVVVIAKPKLLFSTGRGMFPDCADPNVLSQSDIQKCARYVQYIRGCWKEINDNTQEACVSIHTS